MYYQEAIKVNKDAALRLNLLSNSAQCYLDLEMYEDALWFASLALAID